MLRTAHKGYEYQDLLAGIRLVDMLLGSADTIHVDQKLVPDDRFDDLTTFWGSGLRERCQFKFSDNDGRPLPLSMFTTDARGCKLDRLARSAIADRDALKPEPSQYLFRLVVRDTAPDDERLIRALRQVDHASPPGPEFGARRYRFDSEVLWPAAVGRSANTDPWTFLRDGMVSRENLVWFCENFSVEVDAPAASFDLTMPGAAERMILHRVLQDIGAETYPNEHRSAVDVAAALIGVARVARAGAVIVTREELVRRARLRTDFGAVSRAHPIVTGLEITRPGTVHAIVEAADRAAGDGVPLILTSSPGGGKSWACQRVVDALQADGWLVAEHYCYLGSGDMDRDERVAAQAVFGSLLSRIAESDPSLVEQQRPRFAANEQALVAAIEASVSSVPRRRIALLIDGLDHVTRVLGAIAGRPDPSRSFAEELALLSLPRGSVLIVASQPGPHLEPLEAAGAVALPLPAWTREEIGSLAEKLGIIAAAQTPGENLVAAADDRGRTAVIDALTERSVGNPLFATYLCRELLRSPVALGDPVAVVMSLPAFDGTLQLYYEHLVSPLGLRRWVAEMVALLEFAVTRAELRQIYPEAAHYVDDVLELLGPVLVERSAQGGIRVYHESFARYLLRSLEDERNALQARLGQVISWLEGRGLFTDARAYRYLLPLRARAGRDEENVAEVSTEFVAKSVAAGFGASAISGNLAVAAGSAGRTGNWPALVRCVELARAAATYEFDNLPGTVVEFADIPLALLGPSTFADRLLYDGRTTVPSRPGLQLCAAADRAGAVAPWSEYLEAFGREREVDNTHYGDASDRAVWLAWLLGKLRMASSLDDEQDSSVQPNVNSRASQSRPANEWADPRRLAAWLEGARLPADDVIDVVESTIGLADAAALVPCLPTSLRGAYALALAEWLSGHQPSAEDVASVGSVSSWIQKARACGIPPGWVARLISLGVDIADLAGEYDRERLLELTQQVQERGIQFEPDPILRWLDAVDLAARLDPLGLSAAEASLSGPGWYHCWLRFAVAVARAGVPGAKVGAMEALGLLTEDMRPFVGDPRACDLYQLHGVIAGSIRQALALIEDNNWRPALDVLATVSAGVSTTISGELGGPLPRDLLLQLVVEFTDRDRLPMSDEFVLRFLGDRGRGRYYSDLARFELFAARLALTAGDHGRAAVRYERAMRLLVAYGWHKDITIYELLDPLPALIGADRREASIRISALQPLCERVVRHTDGKDTRHAPAEWWKHLVVADPTAAGWMLLDGLLASPNVPRPRLDRAREDLWRAHSQLADPIVSATLRLTLDLTLDRCDAGLLERLADIAGPEPDSIIRHLAEWLMSRGDERTRRNTDTSGDDQAEDVAVRLVEAINTAGRRLGAAPLGSAPLLPGVPDAMRPPREGWPLLQGSLADRMPISYGSGTTALIRGIREWMRCPYGARGERWDTDRFVNAVGYRLIEMHMAGAGDEAATVLRMLADGLRFGDDKDVLSALAGGLERHGVTDLAVQAHVLAFTRSRGGGGWLTFGGEEYLDSLRRAVVLDEQRSRSILASEVQRAGGSYGVTRSLVHAVAELRLSATEASSHGDDTPSALAFAMWDAAFDVIGTRLPCTDEDHDLEVPYVPSGANVPGISGSPHLSGLDVALAAATIAGLAHPGRERKRRGLLAVHTLVRLRPAVVGPALGRALSTRIDVSTLTWLLGVLCVSDVRGLMNVLGEPLRRLASASELRVRTLARHILLSGGDVPGPVPVGPPEAGLLEKDSDASTDSTLWIPRRTDLGGSPNRANDARVEAATPADHDARHPARADLLVTERAGHRLSRVDDTLPGLRRTVVARVVEALATEGFQRRMRAQLDHLSNSANPHWPDAIIAGEETVERALQQIAGGGRAALAAAGRLVTDPEGWESAVTAGLDDDPLLALAVEAARAPRPLLPLLPGRGDDEWERASATNGGDGERIGAFRMVRYPSEPPDRAPSIPYLGTNWRAIGIVEHRYLRSDHYPHTQDGEVIRSAALEVRPDWDESGLDGQPLGYGDAQLWMSTCATVSEPIADHAQPLVGLIGGPGADGARGWPGLGFAAPLLAPQPRIIAMLQLVPGNDWLELALYDSEGCGLVYRIWRSLYETSEYELPRPSICGSALLLRSDLFDRLLGNTGGRLAWREHLIGRNVIADPTRSGAEE